MTPYAGNRSCWDADSHRMPLPDFPSKHANPALREARIGEGARQRFYADKFKEMFAIPG